VEVGFEMIIFSFGSGFNLESNNATYIESIAADVAYAHKNNIQVVYNALSLSLAMSLSYVCSFSLSLTRVSL